MGQSGYIFGAVTRRFGGISRRAFRPGWVMCLLVAGALPLWSQDPSSLPANTFWIEAEDYDYEAGKSVDAASKMPYVGGALAGLEGVVGVDLGTTLGSENSGYRGSSPAWLFGATGWDLRRPGGVVADMNYHVGVESGASWFNFTRSIPQGTYRVYAVMSHEHGERANMRGSLARVIAGRGTPNQTLDHVGYFSARGSGGWFIKQLVPLVDGPDGGFPVVLQVGAGQTTLRFVQEAGTIDWIGLVPVADPEIVVNPPSGFNVPNNSRLTFDLTAFDTRIDLTSIQAWFDDVEVTEALRVTGESRQARVYYRHPVPMAVGAHTWRFSVFTVGTPGRQTVRTGGFNAYVPVIRPDLLHRRAQDLQFAGDMVYSADGAEQTRTFDLAPGDRSVLFVMLRNRGSGLSEFVVSGSGAGEGWGLVTSLGGTNVSAAVLGAGYGLPAMLRSDVHEFRVEVQAPPEGAAGTSRELVLRVHSVDDPSLVDTVRVFCQLIALEASPLGATYSEGEDFARGTSLGVVATNAGSALRLAPTGATLPYLWVPNSNDGTVSRIDTRTGRELGRYRTGPLPTANPSRSAVDLDGNCWVGNRGTGTLVKIGLLEAGAFDDRNHNGVAETSRDLNGDGNVLDDEVLPWGADECVMLEVSLMPGLEGAYVPGTPGVPYSTDNWAPGPRGVAVDVFNRLWASTFSPGRVHQLDIATGRILKSIDVSSVPHSSYGLAFDNDGYLWSSGFSGNHVLRIDPTNGTWRTVAVGHMAYGLGLDRSRRLYVSGFSDAALSRVSLTSATVDWTRAWPTNVTDSNRGLVCTEDGDIWSANSGSGTVGRWSATGVLRTNIAVGRETTGVAVDSTGKVWAVNNLDNNVVRIDPALNTVDLRKTVVGTRHYGYSDLTGFVSRNVTLRSGSWSVVHDSRRRHTGWGTVTWNGSVPSGSALAVRVRSSEENEHWSEWEPALNGYPLQSTPPGRFLEVRVEFQARSVAATPVLQDLSILPLPEPATPGELYYATGFEDAAWPINWSEANVTASLSPVHGALLGPFGAPSRTVLFTLGGLPPHSAIEVLADVAVLGRWWGNNLAGGPGRWTLTLAGRGGVAWEPGRALVDTTFSQGGPGDSDPQAFPGTFPFESFPARSGAVATNVLGLGWAGPDTVYRLARSFAHDGPSLQLRFDGEAAWALDRFELRLFPVVDAPRLVPLEVGVDGSFRFQVLSAAGGSVRVDRSKDLRSWTPVSTNLLLGAVAEVTQPGAITNEAGFFRALRVP